MQLYSFITPVSELTATSLVNGLRRAGFPATLEKDGQAHQVLTSAPVTLVRKEGHLRSTQLVRHWAA